MTRHALTIGLVVLFISSAVANAQTSASTTPIAPTRDPQALTLAAGALRALAGPTPLSDITLQGSATYIAGSDEETGPATLLASGNLQSRVVLNLTDGPRTETRSGPFGNWIGPDGVVNPMAIHNCWPDAAWFYPGLNFQALATDAGLAISYVGPETKNGFAVQHLLFWRLLSGQTPKNVALVQSLSATDVYLDAASYLPLFLDFNVHPDADLGVNLAIEIQFSDYQLVNGVRVPGRIQKFLNGGLALDLTISAAAVNSGLPASEFAIQ